MKIALIGYGKMGKMIDEVANDLNAFKKEQKFDIQLRIDKDQIGKVTDEELKKVNIAIEFSTPQAAFNNIKRCIDVGVPVVSGTTGWLQKWEEIVDYSIQMNGALLYASNFSIGMNIFFEVNRHLANIMAARSQYDVEVNETHHVQKLDSPSGSAITLAKDILHTIPTKKQWVNKPSGKHDDLLILSHREGQVPGRHQIKYESVHDEITILHNAKSRKGFAEGALLAAQWLVGKKGIYSMKDVLSL